jgi:ribonuclease HI
VVGTPKINVGAVFCPQSGEAAVGVVAMSHTGSILLATSRLVGKAHDAEEVEVLAILEGLKLAIDHDLMPASLESDSAIAVLNANATAENKSRSWAVYRDIAAASTMIPLCKVVKIGRNINRVVHDLASLAKVNGLSHG